MPLFCDDPVEWRMPDGTWVPGVVAYIGNLEPRVIGPFREEPHDAFRFDLSDGRRVTGHASDLASLEGVKWRHRKLMP